MEGLDLNEKLFSETLDNKDFRIDSQFHTQEPYKNPKLMYEKIGNLLIRAQYGISISMNEDEIGYPIYRMNEIHNMLCDSEVSKCASISLSELETFTLNDRDVIFNRTNSLEWVGRTGIYRKLDARNFVFASYLVRFIPDQKIIMPEYLAAFLSCKFGVNDIKRRARQSINQSNVNPEEVKEIEIPKLSQQFQNKIKLAFDTAFKNNALSIKVYTQAENILLEEIGLHDFEPSQELVNIKSFKDSFGTSGRLDAEYYQKKYDDFINVVHQYQHGFDKVSVCCDVKISNYKPDDNTTYKYIELSNVGKSGDINGCTVGLGSELPSRARRNVVTGDVVISSIEGSLTSCALVTHDYHDALCSTGFYVIQSSRINSETLLVLFKSKLMQNILKQNCSGTILTAVNKNEFLNIELPIVIKEKQQQISTFIQQSFALKKQSEHLLDVAKRAVEIAIEEDEAAALAYIQTEVAEYDF